MTDAYMKWAATQGEYGMESAPEPVDPDNIEKVYKVRAIDVFGLIPCAPWTPKLAIATRVLEKFRVARLRCPQLSVQSWMKTLADLHGLDFKPYTAQQFTVCFDVYLEILQNVDAHVKKALGRDAADYRLKNNCPACTYKLEGEAKLIFEMLVTSDGNSSLKRVLRKEQGVFDENGVPQRGGTERVDPRTAEVGGDYFLSREKVDQWSKEKVDQWSKERSADPEEDSECQERWKNMSEEITARMWGIFDETGMFLSLCRHGFVLLVADMVKSGELAKCGLAISNALMDAFGADLGSGYDIGCGFDTTIKNSPLGPKAKDLNFKMLVGAFHGHAHHRMCQLRYLATYVLGLGVEDLEGCERFFSKSNALSRSVRYASVFHRKQTIATYLAHTDNFETYPNLSKFLMNNYKQALEILDTEKALKFAMEAAGINGREDFIERLEQEKAYLKGLSKEPEAETQQMEYYQRLVNLSARRETFDIVFAEGSKENGTVKRHARENFDKAMTAVQEIERGLEVQTWWTPGSKEWQDAALLAASRRYRLSVNWLETLVVRSLFELTKMNMSQTGYKLRKHIAKALQVRSKTIRRALTRYNAAAAALTPRRHSLTWAEVIDYAFLSDFDILRDPDGNAALRPWADPAARHLMDCFFKIERAREEITRLNIEIRRLVTYIRDEKEVLLKKESEVSLTDPHLAFFIGKYRLQRGRFDETHMKRLCTMVKKLGSRFTGTLVPGVRREEEVEEEEGAMDVDGDNSVAAAEVEAAAVAAEIERGRAEEAQFLDGMDEWEDVEDDDEGEIAEGEGLAEMTERVLTVATDELNGERG
ncbi:hypothetical protein DFH09DRAFT_1244552 [Mycena vulgaris]|nr:hypothetical protein DFH09DRAFT_1244552 [Mycena vulgaris]